MRGFRGAICVTADEPAQIREATGTLIQAMMDANQIAADDLISLMLTCTPDLTSAFPAEGARHIGLTDVPLLCAVEMDVAGALPRVIRVLMHAESALDRGRVTHIYLRGAEALRPDLQAGRSEGLGDGA